MVSWIGEWCNVKHAHTLSSGTEMNESCVWHLISRWGFRPELVLSFRGANRLLNRCPMQGGWDNFTFGAISLIYPTFSHLSCSDAPFWLPTHQPNIYYSKTQRWREKKEKAWFIIITPTKPQGLIQWISSWKPPFCKYQHAFHLSMPWSYYVTSQREFNSLLEIGH